MPVFVALDVSFYNTCIPPCSQKSFFILHPPMAAAPQEKPIHAKETWPLRNDGNEDYSQDFEDPDSSFGCGCFQGLFRWRFRLEGQGYLLQQEEAKESWLKRKAKELKEVSEVLAGPKWKNFIRRFSVYGANKKRRSTMKMQYDIQSYELNFDEGIHREADAAFLDFSARFAAPCGINKG
ncbi:hypothetical protein ES319_A06G108300v1 [Gossypium barbadense]|uniref:Uncharacterized protein n=5 Tax=Gossypium TaxID=3633 RepID=A0A5J5VC39_GOSBA|nr:hypothetical protein ES319_A06G108300v1 [Gossypium barbadense]TYH13148.1 hypothetical protein ES288_A06G120900v1 [Gossypium darwinii]TYI22669.1 hypothetical protein ES332_A06G118700v1 [Gossypium tomentosum]